MGFRLRNLGLIAFAMAVWALLAGAVGWISSGAADLWAPRLAAAGVVLLAAGLAVLAWSPISRELTRGRCVRCGSPIERRQTYCRDHLQTTVNELRDRNRNDLAGRQAR